jgi:hypothetical protein
MDADDVAIVKFRRVINLIKAKFIESLEVNSVGNQVDERLDEVNSQFFKIYHLLLRSLDGKAPQGKTEMDVVDLFNRSGGLERAKESGEARALMRHYSELDLCTYPYTLNMKLAKTFEARGVPGQKICDTK